MDLWCGIFEVGPGQRPCGRCTHLCRTQSSSFAVRVSSIRVVRGPRGGVASGGRGLVGWLRLFAVWGVGFGVRLVSFWENRCGSFAFERYPKSRVFLVL